MSGFISSTGADLSSVFAKSILTNDVSFSSIVSFSSYAIQSSFIVATGNISISSNYPNIIFINSASNFNITLPTNPSQSGIMIQVRQISGTTPLTIGYPNQIRLGNVAQTTYAQMNYSLCSLSAGDNLNYWYLFYRPP